MCRVANSRRSDAGAPAGFLGFSGLGSPRAWAIAEQNARRIPYSRPQIMDLRYFIDALAETVKNREGTHAVRLFNELQFRDYAGAERRLAEALDPQAFAPPSSPPVKFVVRRLTLASPLEAALQIAQDHGGLFMASTAAVAAVAGAVTTAQRILDAVMKWQNHQADLRARQAEAGLRVDVAHAQAEVARLMAEEARRMVIVATGDGAWGGNPSPDRVDSLVGAITEIARYRLTKVEKD